MPLPTSYYAPKPNVDLRDFWVDPDPDKSPGVLLSDRIRFYCERVLLVWPWDEEFIEPASYTLHAGNEYLTSLGSGHVESRSLERETRVIIPPNGLIYIQFYEEVNIPHYMITRFNLRVSQVYRGLLLGTGPQVDPGFRGKLGCPIHNFTDSPKEIKFCEPLITIDFEKTTRLGQTSFEGVGAKQLRDADFQALRAGTVAIEGLGGRRCKAFNKRNNAAFIDYLPGGQSVRSSVAALKVDVETVQNDMRLYKKIAALGVLGLFIGVLGLIFSILLPMYTDLKNDITNRYVDLKNEVSSLARTVSTMEGRAAGMTVAPSPSGAESKSPPVQGPPESKTGAPVPGR